MVLLEFEIDESVLAKDRRLYPESTELSVQTGVLSETFFEMPVRLRMGDVELLEWQGEGYPLPLLHMAALGLDSVRQVRRNGTASLRLPGDGDLWFELSGDDIVIQSTQTRRTGRAPYEELLQAWEEFAVKVREFLSREFPQLKDHAYWGKWFRSKDLELPEYRP